MNKVFLLTYSKGVEGWVLENILDVAVGNMEWVLIGFWKGG
jgi:hypothetical protein